MNSQHRTFYNLMFLLLVCLMKEEDRDMVIQDYGEIAMIDVPTFDIEDDTDPLDNLASDHKPEDQAAECHVNLVDTLTTTLL